MTLAQAKFWAVCFISDTIMSSEENRNLIGSGLGKRN